MCKRNDTCFGIGDLILERGAEKDGKHFESARDVAALLAASAEHKDSDVLVMEFARPRYADYYGSLGSYCEFLK